MLAVIPQLTKDGYLPPGVHSASWVELQNAFGTTPHRIRLLNGLREAAKSLTAAGCKTLYVDGSFVTSRLVPGDFDACWDAAGVDPGKLDPVLLDFNNRRAAQKAKYGGELFLASTNANSPPAFRAFLDFFQETRDGDAKGIIAIDLDRWQP